MDTSTRIRLAPASRSAWRELLARQVPTPELEPPVRRRARRHAIHLGACSVLYRKDHRPIELRVKLMNASPDGVMVLSREAVPEDIAAVVAFSGDRDTEYVLVGDVVHCTSTVGGYKIGIRLRFQITDDVIG